MVSPAAVDCLVHVVVVGVIVVVIVVVELMVFFFFTNVVGKVVVVVAVVIVVAYRSGVLRMQKLRTPPGGSHGLSNVPSF